MISVKSRPINKQAAYSYLDDFCSITESRARFKTYLKRMISHFHIRKIAIDRIGEKTAQAYLARIRNQKDIAPLTKRGYIRIITNFFYYLKQQGVISKNPFTKKDKIRRIDSELLKAYMEDCKRNGTREETIKSYRSCIHGFMDYLDEQGLDIIRITMADAIAYVNYLREMKHSKTPVYEHQLVSLKSFYGFLFKQKLTYANPFKNIQIVRHSKRVPRNLPREKEMDELLEQARNFNTGNRFERIRRYKLHVIFELLYATGMRSGEAARLKPEDIDFEKGVINIVQGKGGINRIALLNDYTKEILRIYLKVEPLLHSVKHKGNDTLFRLGEFQFNYTVNKELKNYGNYTSHVFRHSVGYHLLKAGCDIRYIQELLGHERLRSTEIYTKVDKEDLVGVIDKFHPRQFHEA